KLGLTDAEFEDIMNTPPKTIYDYPSYAKDRRDAMGKITLHNVAGQIIYVLTNPVAAVKKGSKIILDALSK
ncbi:MAG: hypothetical protein JW730_21575, partial [Anaerolineales bacterium]|nr:hypothetical protein [Anaerolineales bacterium]